MKFPPSKKWAKCSRCGLTAHDLKDGACPEEVRCKAVAGGVSLGGADFPTTVAGAPVASSLPKRPEVEPTPELPPLFENPIDATVERMLIREDNRRHPDLVVED